MTIQCHFLTKVFTFSLIFITSSVYANSICTSEKEVLIRKGAHGHKFEKRVLEDLYCGKGFEGKYFKVVYHKSNEAISLDEKDIYLKRRAANVYYHVSKAREFWVNEVKSKYVKDLDQVTIRVEIPNSFSRVGHFTSDDAQDIVNNAWTVPAGETPNKPWVKNKHKWGREIWFAPMKKVESRNLVTPSGDNPLTQNLKVLASPVGEYIKGNIIQSTLGHLAYPAYQSTTLLNMLFKNVGAMAIMFATIEISKKMDKIFMTKYYYLDTAMIPEIIYHEFSHVALSDKLNPVHSVPVIEGMADYFATRIAKTVKMYKGIKKFSTNAAKNAKSKAVYNPLHEHKNNATSDFTLSFLWRVKAEMDKQNNKRVKTGRPIIANPDQLIYEARNQIDESSSILELTQALRKTCDIESVCENKRLGVGVLNLVYAKKGF